MASDMIERVARAMREHWYAYQITGELRGDLYVTANGVPLAGPFKTMEAAEFGRDCVIARTVIAAMREPTPAMCATAYFDADHSIEAVGDLAPAPQEQIKQIWEIMIDAALGEK